MFCQLFTASQCKLFSFNPIQNQSRIIFQYRQVSSMVTSSQEDLENLSKQELIERVNKLHACVDTLTATLKSRESSPLDKNARRSREKRAIDFKSWKQRRIALKFLYLGWDYQGLQVQRDTSETIEDYLISALEKLKLIRDRKEANLTKCGRTDKGVSAFSQMVALNVRTPFEDGIGVFEPKDYEKGDHHTYPMDYCVMLNRVLPPTIRCLAWSPVRTDFTARFDCKSRTYRYFIPADKLDITSMRTASHYLVGTHDFANLCKLNKTKPEASLVRTVFSVSLYPLLKETNQNDSQQIFVFEICASGFLWHQIRCIATILFFVGQGKECPNIMEKLLNTKDFGKPQYTLASEIPLVLYDCHYNSEEFQWNYDEKSLTKSINALQSIGTKYHVKSQMIKSFIDSLVHKHKLEPPVNNLWLVEEKRKKYKPLLERPICKSSGDFDQNCSSDSEPMT
ncbi:tRNA pseudouridine(38/39) synthase-like [Brevipalpus obovatus]|uniref:tRNA pseudouridine(38/39) synthase-like n=1 Tax=Brevipalpus obovatus TaxID=246614 RepID=UPI003D9DD8AB